MRHHLLELELVPGLEHAAGRARPARRPPPRETGRGSSCPRSRRPAAQHLLEAPVDEQVAAVEVLCEDHGRSVVEHRLEAAAVLLDRGPRGDEVGDQCADRRQQRQHLWIDRARLAAKNSSTPRTWFPPTAGQATAPRRPHGLRGGSARGKFGSLSTSSTQTGSLRRPRAARQALVPGQAQRAARALEGLAVDVVGVPHVGQLQLLLVLVHASRTRPASSRSARRRSAARRAAPRSATRPRPAASAPRSAARARPRRACAR